jgi:hypothetical protein
LAPGIEWEIAAVSQAPTGSGATRAIIVNPPKAPLSLDSEEHQRFSRIVFHYSGGGAVDADECRRRAVLCQQQAARSWGTLQLKFMTAAEAWLQLAQQLDRLEKDPLIIVAKTEENSNESR